MSNKEAKRSARLRRTYRGFHDDLITFGMIIFYTSVMTRLLFIFGQLQVFPLHYLCILLVSLHHKCQISILKHNQGPRKLLLQTFNTFWPQLAIITVSFSSSTLLLLRLHWKRIIARFTATRKGEREAAVEPQGPPRLTWHIVQFYICGTFLPVDLVKMQLYYIWH